MAASCHPRANALSSMPFIGLPCPTNRTGISTSGSFCSRRMSALVPEDVRPRPLSRQPSPTPDRPERPSAPPERGAVVFWLGLDEVVAAGRVVGMQVLVALLTTRPVGKELLVEFDDVRVLMRLAQGETHVFAVDRFGPGRADRWRGGNRLSAAAQASARAGHDFDEVAL